VSSQGKRILNSHLYETGQNLEEVVLVPGSQEAFAFDAPLAGFLLFIKFRAIWRRRAKFSGP